MTAPSSTTGEGWAEVSCGCCGGPIEPKKFRARYPRGGGRPKYCVSCRMRACLGHWNRELGRNIPSPACPGRPIYELELKDFMGRKSA